VLPAGRTLGVFAAALRHPEVQDRPSREGVLESTVAVIAGSFASPRIRARGATLGPGSDGRRARGLGGGPALKGRRSGARRLGPDANDAVRPSSSLCLCRCVVVAFWRKGDSRARVVTTFRRFAGSGSERDSPSCRRRTTFPRFDVRVRCTNYSNRGQELVSQGLGLDALGEIGVDLCARGWRRAGSRRRERGHADGERNRLLEHRVVERPGGVERERILLI
jgi:hypothetical protein